MAELVKKTIITELINAGLKEFHKCFSGDQVWEVGPDEVPKEINLIDQRVNDHFPQGREKCKQFLRFCQSHRCCCRIIAKRTSPYWTWNYEIFG